MPRVRDTSIKPSVFDHEGTQYGSALLSSPAALKIISQAGDVVYALRLEDGLIKIGHTKRLHVRRAQLQGKVLAFRFGTYEDEQETHQDLQASVAHGREYYHPTPQVLAVVNEWREDLELPLLAA